MRLLFAAVGLVFFGLGAVGVFLPVLPTTPFLLVSAFCFAKSFPRLENWFKSTGLYKKYISAYTENRAMTVKAKVTVMATVTALMAFGFIMMDALPAARALLCAVWLCHALYLTFRVKTIKEQ